MKKPPKPKRPSTPYEELKQQMLEEFGPWTEQGAALHADEEHEQQQAAWDAYRESRAEAVLYWTKVSAIAASIAALLSLVAIVVAIAAA